MPPRVRRFWLVAVLALGCTPPLTADDALPFQNCVRDSDCTFDSLECGGCGEDLAINAAEQEQFDQMKGCWPPSSASECEGIPEPFGCTPLLCASGRCAIANDACQQEFTGGTSGTTGCLNGTCTTGGGTTFGGDTTGGFGGNTTGFSTTGTSGGAPPDGGPFFDGGGGPFGDGGGA